MVCTREQHEHSKLPLVQLDQTGLKKGCLEDDNLNPIVPISELTNGESKIIYQRNANWSSFLQLPVEIRVMIFKHLFGNKIVHLHYGGHCDEPEDINDFIDDQDSSYLWCHILCQKGQQDDVPDLETSISHITSARPVHHRSDHCDKESAPQIQLSTLRVCRQVYEEARTIPWTTNTFSFSNPMTFRVFIEGSVRSQGMTLWQKKTMRSLRLHIQVKYHRAWSYGIKVGHCRELTGLRQLRLRIQHSAVRFAYTSDEPPISILSDPDPHYLFPYGVGLKRLSIVPWNEVEVAFEIKVESRRRVIRLEEQSTHQGTKVWQDLITTFRNCLLDPYGAQAYAYDVKRACKTPKQPRMNDETLYLGFIKGRMIAGFPGYGTLIQIIETDNEERYEAGIQELLAEGLSEHEIPIAIVQKAILARKTKAIACLDSHLRSRLWYQPRSQTF